MVLGAPTNPPIADLRPTKRKCLDRQEIGGRTVKAAKADHHFGYTLFKPTGGGNRDASYYDTSGTAKIACTVEPTKVTCE